MLVTCLRRPQHGLTLTETLTALVVLGIGVLCIATVYLERTQAAPAVLLHSKASRLATEMATQMRTHDAAQVHFENPVGVVCSEQPEKATAQQRAINQVVCWQDKIAATLPNGSGAIAFDSESIPKAYLITVSWSPPNSSTASYLLRVELPQPARQLAAPQLAEANSAATTATRAAN